MIDLVAMQAAQFAKEKHAKQVRKYTGNPYFDHLEEVAELTRAFNLGGEAETLAYLHDTVEDTDTTHKELVEKFGVQIAMGVRALTNTPKDAGNRATRKAMDRRRLADAPEIVQSVKCCDLISNARDIVRYDPDFAVVFLDEMDELIKVLRLAHKGVHQFANMTCQVEQLYLYLNNVKKDKDAKNAVSNSSTQASTGPETDGAGVAAEGTPKAA